MPSPTASAGTADLSALFAPATMTEQTRKRMYGITCELAERYQDGAHAHLWVVAFSGGKDSTLLTHRFAESGRPRRLAARAHRRRTDQSTSDHQGAWMWSPIRGTSPTRNSGITWA